MSEARDIIVKLLSNIGGRKEVEQYLRHYCSVESQKFAVIALGGAILENRLDTVASALSFLQAVGLYPIVVHGCGPALDRALAAEGFADDRVDGIRVVPPPALELHRRVLQDDNLALVDALSERRCPSRPIASGVLRGSPRDRARLGLVGAVDDVDATALSAAIRSQQLPIVSSLAISTTGQALVVDVEEAAGAIARAIEPHKIIFLTGQGGLHDREGKLIEAVNLSEDYARLQSDPAMAPDTRQTLARIKALLEQLPETASVSITSPDHLARELFTHRGAGTLVRVGERVERFDSFEAVDRARLQDLVETCFGRPLAPGYFEHKSCYQLYVSEHYRATAILTREGDVPYLDKFAVTTKAQGEGLGGSVWARLRRDNPRLFWRSRADNPVNAWYFQQADGSYRRDRWTVFWYGLDSFDDVRASIEIALALPPTLRDHGSDG